MVEHFLAKEDVARSNRVTRSILENQGFQGDEEEVFKSGILVMVWGWLVKLQTTRVLDCPKHS